MVAFDSVPPIISVSFPYYAYLFSIPFPINLALLTARGRKAKSLNGDQWKVYSPVLSLCLNRFFAEKKVANVQPLVNKYLHLVKGAIFNFAPIGDQGTIDKVGEMIDYVFEYVVETMPELESLAAFAVTVMEGNKKEYAVIEDKSGY